MTLPKRSNWERHNFWSCSSCFGYSSLWVVICRGVERYVTELALDHTEPMRVDKSPISTRKRASSYQESTESTIFYPVSKRVTNYYVKAQNCETPTAQLNGKDCFSLPRWIIIGFQINCQCWSACWRKRWKPRPTDVLFRFSGPFMRT